MTKEKKEELEINYLFESLKAENKALYKAIEDIKAEIKQITETSVYKSWSTEAIFAVIDKHIGGER